MSEDADEAIIDIPEVDTPEPDAPNPSAEIEAAAAKGGWTPKDQWNGKPEEWLDAPQFVLKGAEILPEVRKALKEARDENKGIKKTLSDLHSHLTRTETRMYEKARKDLEAELDQHTLDGNVAGVRAVTKDLEDLAKDVAAGKAVAPANPSDPLSDPAFAARFETWREENPWYETDAEMTDYVLGLGNRLAREGLTPAQQLVEGAKRVKAAFPHKFKNPNRDLPAAVEGAGGARPKAGKTFNDLPADAKAMCLSFEKDIKGFKREQYVKDYFA